MTLQSAETFHIIPEFPATRIQRKKQNIYTLCPKERSHCYLFNNSVKC